MTRTRGPTVALGLLVACAACGGDGGSPAAPPAATPAPPATTPAPPAATPAPPPTPEPPASPTGLQVSAFGTDFIAWRWNAVEGADGYEVQFRTDDAFTDADERIVRTAEETSYRRESLPPDTRGYLRVRAFVGDDPARLAGDWSGTASGITEPRLREHGQGIATTSDGRILMELGPDDLAYGNPFDLTGRTVVFTPDAGGYRREVRALEHEETVGEWVRHGSRVPLKRFSFPFADETWDSVQVSVHGILMFGDSNAQPRPERNATMAEIAQVFERPTISPLYKPLQYGEVRVSSLPERVVVTWSTREGEFYGAPGIRQSTTEFQAVLESDGAIRFNYRDVQFEDSVVGLFPYESGRKAEVLVSLPSSRKPALPGYLDLLGTTVHATHSDAVVVEFETRDPLPAPDPRRTVSYRLWFDFDRPYWRGDDDVDLIWFFDQWPSGDQTFSHGRVLPAEREANTVAVLALVSEWAGRTASVQAEAVEFYDGSFAGAEFSRPMTMEFPEEVIPANLSQAGTGTARSHQETFSYTAVPDTRGFSCRVIDELGDQFDVVVFNSEFRVDHQESRTPFHPVYQEVEGIGLSPSEPPCGGGRLKGNWELPVWAVQLNEAEGFSTNLALFAHEFIHTWTAHASFVGARGEEPLFGGACNCHWRNDLHIPAAFPWRGSNHASIMGGSFWRENSDGTFTRVDDYESGGPAWLDLYLMGLAEAAEVPDMFLLRDLQPVVPHDSWSPHRGEKETVSIRQLIAAEGLRRPTAAQSQKDFNAAFVYLLEPGQKPTRTLFSTHGRWRKKTVEHWFHITGGRSVLTTTVDPVAAGLPR